MLGAAQLPVADRAAGGVEAVEEGGAVPDDAGSRAVGELALGDHVAAADLDRIEAQLARRHVHHALHHEGRDRPPDAAIGAAGRLRGRHRPGPRPVIADPVGAGQEAHHLDRLDAGGPGIDRVGARVAQRIGLQRDDPPVRVDAEPGLQDLVEGLGGGGQILAPVAEPLDRPAQSERDRGQADILGIERRLGAEPAADIRRRHPDAAARQRQDLGQRVAQYARHLGGDAEVEQPRAPVVARHRAPGLQRQRRLAVHPEAPADADRRPRHRLVHRAAREAAGGDHVAAGVFVHPWRRLAERPFRVDLACDGRDVERDCRGRVLGEIAAVGDHRGDRLARIAHDVRHQRVERGGVVVPHPRGRADRPRDVGEIGGGEHRDHAGHGARLRRVDPVEPAMRHVGAAKRDMRQPVQPAVVHEVAEPAQQPPVLAPRDARPHQARARGRFGHGSPPSAREGGSERLRRALRYAASRLLRVRGGWRGVTDSLILSRPEGPYRRTRRGDFAMIGGVSYRSSARKREEAGISPAPV